MFFLTLTLLKSTGQTFCNMYLNLGLSSVPLMRWRLYSLGNDVFFSKHHSLELSNKTVTRRFSSLPQDLELLAPKPGLDLKSHFYVKAVNTDL